MLEINKKYSLGNTFWAMQRTSLVLLAALLGVVIGSSVGGMDVTLTHAAEAKNYAVGEKKLGEVLQYHPGDSVTVVADISGEHHQLALSLVPEAGKPYTIAGSSTTHGKYSFTLKVDNGLSNKKYTAHLMVADFDSENVFLFLFLFFSSFLFIFTQIYLSMPMN